MAKDSGRYPETKQDGYVLPDYSSDFIKAFGTACELSSNSLNDQMRKALYPLFVGFQNALERVKIDTQLSCQNSFQEYIKGEVLPQIEKIAAESLGPLTTKYEEQSKKLKEAISKVDGSIEAVVRKLMGDLIKTILEPKLHEILEKFRTSLDAKITDVDNKYSTEIENLKKSLEEIKTNYKKPAETKEEPKKEVKPQESLASLLDLSKEEKK